MAAMRRRVYCISLHCLLYYCVLIYNTTTSVNAENDIGSKCENVAGGNENGKSGVCIPAQQCDSVMSVVQRDNHTMTPKTLRLLQAAHCGFVDKDKPLLCCPNGTFILPPASSRPSYINRPVTATQLSNNGSITTVIIPNQQNSNDTGERGSPENIIPVFLNDTNVKLLPIDLCGYFSSDRILLPPNVIQLSDVRPTLARLSYKTEGKRGEQVRCVGTLISPRYVLTAAHCIVGFSSSIKLSSVILGDFDVKTDPDCETRQGFRVCRPLVDRLSVQETIVHPDYRSPSNIHDVALIRLNRAANMTTELELISICLPLGLIQFKTPSHGTWLKTSGWGTLENGTAQYRKRLHGNVNVDNSTLCPRGFHSSIHYCAIGKTQTDGLLTDSGGPLMAIDSLQNESGPQAIQIGIETTQLFPQVPPKNNTQAKPIPRLFTKVAPYLAWIVRNLSP